MHAMSLKLNYLLKTSKTKAKLDIADKLVDDIIPPTPCFDEFSRTFIDYNDEKSNKAIVVDVVCRTTTKTN